MVYDNLSLNEWAASVAEDLLANADVLGCDVHDVGGAQVVDCGVNVPGSIEAGQLLALASLADLADIELMMDRLEGRLTPRVSVSVSEPAVGCLLSQYAGWKIQVDDYFAMGSGPMRALRGSEPIFEKFGYHEEGGNIAVGVLEASKLPTESVIQAMSRSMDMHPDSLILLVARTASLAGSYQIVSRSVEACLHKLHELGFDVGVIRSGLGSAYLPPIPKDDLTAIARTNDSILYGSEVMLWVEADDAEIERVGAKLPSSASPDYGQSFGEIFSRYGGDFYKIDPLLFSAARIAINNLSTGSFFEFGKTDLPLVAKSFFG